MKLRQTLSLAVLQLLRPLVRLLLRHGLAYDEFAELARRAYVEVAEKDFAITGRKQTTSRISVITGLNRKEVARLQASNAQGHPDEAAFAQTMNRAAKVAVGWMQEHRTRGAAPAVLDAEQFAQLVKKYSGDMPARAVLDELRHSGTVQVDADGALHLAAQGYVPQATDERKVTLLGQHAADLLGSIEHNLSQPADRAYLQQRVFAENIPAGHVDIVREKLREAGRQTLSNARDLLVEHDAGDAPAAADARRVTLGVYYFEEPAASRQDPSAAARPTGNDKPTATGSAKVLRRHRRMPQGPDHGDEE